MAASVGRAITSRFPDRRSLALVLVDLALEEGTLQTRQIAARHSLSPHYLSVVLRELRRIGLVESLKGNRGGHRLSRPAEQINLLDLHLALAGRDGSGAELDAAEGDSPADAWPVRPPLSTWHPRPCAVPQA